MRVKLMIVYPYGLKDWLGNEYKKDNTQVLVGNKFPPLLKHRIRFHVAFLTKEIILYLLMNFSRKHENTISIIIYQVFLTFLEYLFWE